MISLEGTSIGICIKCPQRQYYGEIQPVNPPPNGLSMFYCGRMACVNQNRASGTQITTEQRRALDEVFR